MTNNIISIIIVNYNGADYIGECIDSVLRQTYKNVEIIVLDNHSADHSLDVLRQYKDKIKVIVSQENYGFAKGNNIAIEQAKGDYIALLNNDAVADEHWLELMLKELEDNLNYGSCACKIISYYDRNVLDSAGLLISENGMSRARGRNESINCFSENEEILIPSGCAVLYRKAALDEVGFFDEDFFCYCEDTDLGFRLQLAGWKCLYVASAIVHHRYSETAGKYSLFKAYLIERNHYLFAIKNFPVSLLWLNPLYTIRRYLHQLTGMFNKETATNQILTSISAKKLIVTVLKAHWDIYKMLPCTWGKRRKIQGTRKVSSSQVKDWFKQYTISLDELFRL